MAVATNVLMVQEECWGIFLAPGEQKFRVRQGTFALPFDDDRHHRDWQMECTSTTHFKGLEETLDARFVGTVRTECTDPVMERLVERFLWGGLVCGTANCVSRAIRSHLRTCPMCQAKAEAFRQAHLVPRLSAATSFFSETPASRWLQ